MPDAATGDTVAAMVLQKTRAWWRDRPSHADALMAAALAVLCLLGWVLSEDTKATRSVDALAVSLMLLATLPVALRRRWPIAVLGVASAVVVIRQMLGYPETADTLAVVVAAYSVGAHVANRRAVHWTAGTLLTMLTALNLTHAISQRSTHALGNVLGNGIVFGTAFLLGDNARSRRLRVAALEERAHQLETERELRAAHAVSEERARIARDLHDVLAHSLSVIAVQAGGARRVVDTRPADARDAIGAIELTARESLDELRSLLGALRTDETVPGHRPQPGLDDLPALVESPDGEAIGLVVEGDRRPVSALVGTAAFRIVQEALTNVRKHAGPSSATVTVRYLPDEIAVSVCDDGRGAAAFPAPSRAGGEHIGLGLIGMRERTAICHGRLVAGPRPGGGWQVVATLPTRAPA